MASLRVAFARRGRYLFLTCLLSGLISLLMIGWTNSQINIYVDGETRQVAVSNWTMANRDWFDAEQTPIKEWVIPIPGSWFWPGLKLSTAGSIPVAIEIGGREFWRQVPTMAHILEREKINLGPLDRVESNLGSDEADQYIRIIRVESVIELQPEAIAPSQVRRPERYLAAGQEKIIQEGKPGVRYYKYRVNKEDGIEIGRSLLASWVEVEPQSQIVAYGSQAYPEVTAREGDSLRVIATAYTHTGNRTATGIWPHRGIVAVDPRVIPLGSKLYVEGYGHAVAQDTGGLIKGNRIDVFLDSEAEAIQWGRKSVNVRILGN